MGIFDKKTKGRKSEDFDSPIETIDLSASPAAAASPDASSASPAADEAVANPAAKSPSAEPAKADAKKETKKPKVVDQDYGIEEAIALMRTLPADSIELVVRVVKQTLESTHIDIPTIIVDASAKQERITNRIGVLKEEIQGLENEIKARSTEIGNLEADHKETSMVKERLELAEKLGQRNRPVTQTKLPSPSKKPTGSSASSK